MSKTKILFVTHEMSPFLELSKISEITRQLPQAMQERGYEIRILMPRFGPRICDRSRGGPDGPATLWNLRPLLGGRLTATPC